MTAAAAAAAVADSFLEYDNEVKRDPFAIHGWLQYLNATSSCDSSVRFNLYERALARLPRSYKLWRMYLDEFYRSIRGKCVSDRGYDMLEQLYERALVHLHKMPRIWLLYCERLGDRFAISKCRRSYDRALQSLPITQHDLIWPAYLKYIRLVNLLPLTVRVYRRYLMFHPPGRTDYIEYLIKKSYYEEASRQIAIELNLESTSKSTNHQLWLRLCDLISQYPQQVARELEIEAILRSGIRLFSDQVGRLWCALATYSIRLGEFEKARDVYEEAMRVVLTVRDFSLIFEAYSKFQEEMLTAHMSFEDQDDEAEAADHAVDIDMRLARLEYLMDRRPVLLSSVMLRQNPHNVHEWRKRIELFKKEDSPEKVLVTYTEAVKTIVPYRAVGKVALLWVEFAKYYETEARDLESARMIFQRAINVNFKSVDELALVLCEWAEMEVRHDQFDQALELLRAATSAPDRAAQLQQRTRKGGGPVQDRVYKAVRLWSLYLDFEESLGTIESTVQAYDRAFELQVATAQMVLNYAAFLQQHKYFEDSFRVYERGLVVFGFPPALDIWKTYLKAFLQRYGGKKVERARELYEQVLKSVPIEDARYFYVEYTKLEEKYGRIQHAMKIFERATTELSGSDQLKVQLLYIKKVEEYYGIAQTRPVYERAIEIFADEHVPVICLQFAAMETKLGEIDRARALFSHASQFCDPRKHQESFWDKWHDFEVAHGNEQTFLEMLRIKRAVTTQYAQVNYTVSDSMAAETGTGDAGASMTTTTENAPTIANTTTTAADDPMAQLESKRKTEEEGSSREKRQKVVNVEEIDLDDLDDVEELQVPKSVFGQGLDSSIAATK